MLRFKQRESKQMDSVLNDQTIELNDEPLFLFENQNTQNGKVRNELNEMRSRNDQIQADESNSLSSNLPSILKIRKSQHEIREMDESGNAELANERKISLSASEKSGSLVEQLSINSKNTNPSISSHVVSKYFTYSPSCSFTKLNNSFSSNSIQPPMVIIGNKFFKE
jgi:hypothetical protein